MKEETPNFQLDIAVPWMCASTRLILISLLAIIIVVKQQITITIATEKESKNVSICQRFEHSLTEFWAFLKQKQTNKKT